MEINDILGFQKQTEHLLNLIERGLINADTIHNLTYDYLAAMYIVCQSDENGKDAYINIKRYFESITIQAIRKLDKIVVAFVCCSNNCSGFDNLYNYLDKTERFEPVVVLTPNMYSIDKDTLTSNYDNTLEFYKSRHMRVISTYDTRTGRQLSVRDISPQPSIYFYATPFLAIFPDEMQIYSVPMNALLAYIPYAFLTAENAKGTFGDQEFGAILHVMAWRIFTFSADGIRLADKHSYIGSSNCVITGLPKMDGFYSLKPGQSKIWQYLENKSGLHNAKRIIYAPHHSVKVKDDDIILLSTFRDNYRQMLELARKYDKDTIWVFRPHILLGGNTVICGIFDSINEYNDYAKEWDNCSNAVFMDGGPYQDTFIDSDAMILDCDSFMTEYQFSGHPALHLCRDEQRFNESGTAIMNILYNVNGKDIAGIENFICDVVLSGNDTMKEQRREFFEQNLDYMHLLGKPACESIYDELVKGIFGAAP